MDIFYKVHFRGNLREIEPAGVSGPAKYSWDNTEYVVAVAYDFPVPGYNTYNTLNLRLWSSKPSSVCVLFIAINFFQEFDLGIPEEFFYLNSNRVFQ